MKRIVYILLFAFLTAASFSTFTSCRETHKDTEHEIEDAIDDTGDALEDAVDDTGDAIKEGAQDVEDAVDDAVDDN